MKLHRNAALSWSGRLLLAVRVVEQGWTLTAAAGAPGSACAARGSGLAATGWRVRPVWMTALRRRAESPIARLPIGSR